MRMTIGKMGGLSEKRYRKGRRRRKVERKGQQQRAMVENDNSSGQRFMQDQNVACRWRCARPSRNVASMRGNGKCRIDAHENTHMPI